MPADAPGECTPGEPGFEPEGDGALQGLLNDSAKSYLALSDNSSLLKLGGFSLSFALPTFPAPPAPVPLPPREGDGDLEREGDLDPVYDESIPPTVVVVKEGTEGELALRVSVTVGPSPLFATPSNFVFRSSISSVELPVLNPPPAPGLFLSFFFWPCGRVVTAEIEGREASARVALAEEVVGTVGTVVGTGLGTLSLVIRT